jgi:tRNA-Thr(GGU) m(6)t(6)A37 methyltransferase TsaA
MEGRARYRTIAYDLCIMDKISVLPIGFVHLQQSGHREDYWGAVVSVIELDSGQFSPESLVGLSEFSHIEVLFHLSQVQPDKIQMGSRYPRNNESWPKVGVFAQRAKMRPNRIGATICRLLSVDGLKLTVQGLDAYDGSPVLDIKPVFAEFIPERNQVKQPQWSHELMVNYFSDQEQN